ncbi:MAG: hypothetical protein LBL13_10735 [Bacteroidales bacterium]|jgi:hypothetical protein|nr:hypothetical protein [Bacteroidales bacterium]
MKKLLLPIIIALSLVLSVCCTEKKKNEVLNNGKVLVENGKGMADSIPYDCIDCHSNINDTTIFKTIVSAATKKARNALNYPLSFIPTKLSLTVIKRDSLYYYASDEKIDSVYSILYTYKYIAKNAYGNELEGDYEGFFYLKDGVLTDLSEKIRLTPLSVTLKSKGGLSILNRNLIVVGSDDDYIKITPYIDKTNDIFLNIKSSYNCVDEGTGLTLELENGEEIKLYSLNDYNCDSESLYILPKNKQALLLDSRIKYVSMYYRKTIGGFVDENETDYFQQLVKLAKQ